MNKDMGRKPTLLARFITQNSMAAAVALLIMLALALLLADRAALAVAARSLSSDLNQVESVEQFAERFKGRGSRILLDSSGKPVTDVQGAGNGGGKGPGAQEHWVLIDPLLIWEKASEAYEAGTMSGYGGLPWVDGNVLWASRVLLQDDQTARIMVIWEKVGSVRAEGWPIYAIGIFGIIISFVLNLFFSRRAARKISAGLREVADAGRMMAAGDYNVSLPEQEISELDQIGKAFNELAANLKIATEELKDEAKRLVRLEDTQKRFIADASHEIRAPLATMAITLDAWKDGLLSEDEKADALGHVRSELTRLSKLAEQLLDLSRIESGRLQIELASVNVEAVICSVLESYRNIEGAKVSFTVQPGLNPALADEQSLHRMIRNLVDNSLRFTPSDGNIEVLAFESEGQVIIEVKDDGPGIPAGELEHMWDRFARAGRDRAAGKAGTGLGLAIVKALADAMSAEVGISSVEGEGTTVSIGLKGFR